MRGLRALLAAVIIMGVLIVLGSATLIAVIIGRATHRTPHANAPVMPSAGATAGDVAPVLVLGQPPGTRIASVTRQSDTLLAVALTGGGIADRLLIWDLASGHIAATLTPAR
jgi:hypothetical protein